MERQSITLAFEEYKEKDLSYTQVIEYLSRLSWRINKNSYEMKLLKMSEETITDLLLMEMSALQDRTIVRKFNKQNQEPKNGADWEWWIKIGEKVVGFRIQSKLLTYTYGKTPVYRGIGKKVKSTNTLQIDNLINEARNGRKAGKLIPIYSFYNYLDNKGNPDYGWTYAYAEVIKEHLNKKPGLNSQFTYEEINKFSRPMKQLLSLSDILKGSVSNYKEELKSFSLSNVIQEKDFIIKIPEDVKNLFGLLQENNIINYSRLDDIVSDINPPDALDYIVVTELPDKD